MGVNQLAISLGVTPDTVRYYTRIGYLTPRRSLSSGYKEYDNEHIHRMRFIISARKLGLSVRDIGRIFGEVEDGSEASELVQELLNERLNEIDKKLEETSALRERMNVARIIWNKHSPTDSTCKRICSLIEDLENYCER
ncbi:MAG: MerR family transcriptional regulator [Gammaproteobacteria bacterium]